MCPLYTGLHLTSFKTDKKQTIKSQEIANVNQFKRENQQPDWGKKTNNHWISKLT